MKNFIVYNQEGVILRTGICADNDLELQAGEGEFVYDATRDVQSIPINDIIHYIAIVDGSPVITEKPALTVSPSKTTILADGNDAVVVGLPNPTTVYVNERIYGTVADGILEFTSEVIGTFEIKCIATNKLPATFTVEAVLP